MSFGSAPMEFGVGITFLVDLFCMTYKAVTPLEMRQVVVEGALRRVRKPASKF